MATDETKIGVVITPKQNSLSWPNEWKGGFNAIKRDNISLQQIHFLMDDFVTDAVLNQFDYVFNTEADFNTWMATTDINSILLVCETITTDPLNPGLSRKAMLSKLDIDMARNSMEVIITIKYYEGNTEQKQLRKQVVLIIDGAQYGQFCMQLNGITPLETVLKNIITQKDSEGAF